MVVTIVTAGEVDPNGVVPTFNGVPGAGTNNWDIAFPTGVLKIGKSYNIETLINDNSYSGPCKGSLELAQEQAGKKVVLAKYSVVNGTCGPGIIYGRDEAITIPNSPGPATLSGMIKYGSNRHALNVPMVIQ
ncbi:MAG: hypothetical protein JO056_06525 [Alphaproteobacteria bacterium]|nr:hypothetical protein [Alphaproteobacteria bacterium]